MRIRWKLFWLLAAISLTPLLLLRINSQRTLNRVADTLSRRVGDHLVAEAKTRMGRFVEDHARLLVSRRQSLSLAVAMQAMAVEQALATTPPPLDPANILLISPKTAGMGPGMGMGRIPATPADPGLVTTPGYFQLTQEGQSLPLPIDAKRLTLALPPGLDSQKTGEQLAALGALLAPYRKIAERAQPLAHFQVTLLTDGMAAIYPARQDAPRQGDPRQAPWYLAALHLPGPVWTAPQAEPGTSRISIAVSTRVHGPDGHLAGVTAIFTPLDDLLASVSMPRHIAATLESLLIVTETDAAGARKVLIEAGEVRRHRAQAWRSFGTPLPMASPDTDVLLAIAADVAHGNSGVRRLSYNGRDALAAYAQTAENEALIQIAPLEEVLAEARAVTTDVGDSFRQLFNFGTTIVAVVMLALVFLSFSASRAITRPLLALTKAARRLADGDFTTSVAVPGKDELSELGRVFNEIAPRLAAHVRLCETMSLASEIQRSLLPAAPPQQAGVQLAAVSRYCDETGGDYYDFLPFTGPKAGLLGVAVGDVSGHGLEAALLMTTARALLRPRAARTGTPAEVIEDVNRELTRDTYGTGRFMTLFYMEIDPVIRMAAFARAGHDPAMLYDPATGTIRELTCRGMALGVCEDARYETGSVTGLVPGHVLLLGSDGLWEAQNAAGAMFGKKRTREVLAQAAPGGAQNVCDALLAALDAFRGETPLDDDVTLLVVTFTPDA